MPTVEPPPTNSDFAKSLEQFDLTYYQAELCPYEQEWQLGNFLAQMPENKSDWVPCLVFQTPLSLFVVFSEVTVRFDEPFDFKMLPPRKNQRSIAGDNEEKLHELTVEQNGKEVSALFRRDASSNSLYKYAREALKDEDDWQPIRRYFRDALIEMEYVFEQLVSDLEDAGKPIGPVPLSMQMFVNAFYTSAIKYHHQALKDFQDDGDFHETFEGINFCHAIILRLLLEYGQKPNKYGCYGQGEKINQDISRGVSSRLGLSLESIHDIIAELDTELAERYLENLKILSGIYLTHKLEGREFVKSDAWKEFDWD